LYDTMSTRYYSHVSVVPGMFINDVRDIDAVRAADFIAEAQAWGMAAEAARSEVDAFLDALPEAIAAEAQASAWAPERLVQSLQSRALAAR
ncbi:MAG: hypothetical protein ACRD0E_05305, partial [Acidimicrobiales bacterium]